MGLRALGLSLEEMTSVLALAHDGTCGDIRTVLGQTLARALDQLEERIEELARSRGQIATIMDGLGRMRAGEDMVPGMTPCACVQLVEERAVERRAV